LLKGEFERASTTLADVYVKPIARSYVQSVATGLRKLDITAPWNVMKSNGGLMIAAKAADHPADMLLSGLAGGVIGGKYFGELAGLADLFTLDMGGTSCDIGVIQAGQQLYAAEFDLDWGLPVTIPCVDVKTIGAGGGSIVFIDKGGFLQVGPHSAGADPGPAAYDRGGTQATLTDANLILGRLNPDYFLGGKMKLNRARAVEVLGPVAAHMGRSLEEVAQAAVDTANENMANAIRLIAVEKGFDPREFTLVAFGGAGSLHASAIARAAQIPRVLVPLHPGLCSAFGALIADWRVDKLWTHYRRSDQMTPAAIETAFQRLSHEALTELAAEGFQGTPLILRSIDMRYAGQNYEQAVPIPDGPITAETIQHVLQRFADLHEAFYGFSIEGEVIELINFRVTAIGSAVKPHLEALPAVPSSLLKHFTHRPVYFQAQGLVDCPIYRRADLGSGTVIEGPAVIEEVDSTTVVLPGDRLEVDSFGLMTIIVGGDL
jgi:N-methylhydantoinase A